MALLAQMSMSQWFFVLLLIGICLFLMLVILVQKGRGEGLSGAFGGGGGSGAFGAKTGDVFTWITVVVAASFIVVSVVANFFLDETPQRQGRTATTTQTTPGESPDSAPGTDALLPPSEGEIPASPDPTAPTEGGDTPAAETPTEADTTSPATGIPAGDFGGETTEPWPDDSEETPGS